MAFEIIGILHKVFETENKTPTFQSREFVIFTKDEQYPQYIKFQLTQSRCDLIDRFKDGDSIKVTFDLSGREWQGKYFTNLNAWRIDTNENVQTQNSQDFTPMPDRNDIPFEISGGADDLPF